MIEDKNIKITSILKDERINAFNVLIEITIGEYLKFAREIIDKNEFQRKRVIKSKIKEILREDLLENCLIPSIVLAIADKKIGSLHNIIDYDNAYSIIDKGINSKEVLIIDGLQRTYVLLGLEDDLLKANNETQLQKLRSHTVRSEIYIGLNRMGLLYRMITLNTGQTTMSTRHLMEILYLDYSRIGIEGITLVKDKDEDSIEENTNSYNFKVILDGFNSYIEKSESIIERTEILDNIKSLEVIKAEEDELVNDEEKDIFKDFLLCHKAYLDIIINKSEDWHYNDKENKESDYKLNSQPFGKSVLDIFKKSQAVTGFGAAIKFTKDSKNLSFDDIKKIMEGIYSNEDDWNTSFSKILKHFDTIKEKSKKIGNDQRFFFKYFFRGLLNPDSDHYQNFDGASDYAFEILRDEKGYRA